MADVEVDDVVLAALAVSLPPAPSFGTTTRDEQLAHATAKTTPQNHGARIIRNISLQEPLAVAAIFGPQKIA